LNEPKKHILARALAYVAITGGKRGLHIWTRIAIGPYVKMSMTAPYHDKVDEAGMALARTSRLWKAHEELLALGFHYKVSRSPGMRHLSYEPDEGPDRFAFTGGHGKTYLAPPDKPYSAQLLTKHRNG
jgi:hypothetical protein